MPLIKLSELVWNQWFTFSHRRCPVLFDLVEVNRRIQRTLTIFVHYYTFTLGKDHIPFRTIFTSYISVQKWVYQGIIRICVVWFQVWGWVSPDTPLFHRGHRQEQQESYLTGVQMQYPLFWGKQNVLKFTFTRLKKPERLRRQSSLWLCPHLTRLYSHEVAIPGLRLDELSSVFMYSSWILFF